MIVTGENTQDTHFLTGEIFFPLKMKKDLIWRAHLYLYQIRTITCAARCHGDLSRDPSASQNLGIRRPVSPERHRRKCTRRREPRKITYRRGFQSKGHSRKQSVSLYFVIHFLLWIVNIHVCFYTCCFAPRSVFFSIPHFKCAREPDTGKVEISLAVP